MHRRPVLAALAVLCSPSLWAAAPGWEAYDTRRPIYLEGRVATLLWGEPGARLELAPDAGAEVPPGLTERLVSAQPQQGERAAQLVKDAVPVLDGQVWQVQLPSLAQLSALEVPRPEIKQPIAVIGHPGPPVERTPTLRAEILVIGDRAYALPPAPRQGQPARQGASMRPQGGAAPSR